LTLAFSPFIYLFAGNYGGELVYRIYVFSLPWCAFMIATVWITGIEDVHRPSRRRHRAPHPRLSRYVVTESVAGAALTVLALAALQGTEGQFAFDHVSPESVVAADYFYDHARPGSTLVLATPNFPGRLDARYRLFNRGLTTEPALTDDPQFEHKRLDHTMISAVTSYVSAFPGREHFLAVSRDMAVEAGYFGHLPAGSLTALREALRGSPRWSVFYENPEVVIFQLG
jgi:hypothetical protein